MHQIDKLLFINVFNARENIQNYIYIRQRNIDDAKKSLDESLLLAINLQFWQVCSFVGMSVCLCVCPFCQA